MINEYSSLEQDLDTLRKLYIEKGHITEEDRVNFCRDIRALEAKHPKAAVHFRTIAAIVAKSGFAGLRAAQRQMRGR